MDNNNKIIIDLKEFEGKNILDLKREIQNELNKIKIIYSAPNPMDKNRTLDYRPYSSADFTDSRNDYTIKKVTLE